MRVSIIGAGAAAFAGAVVLSQNGHDPILWSPSGRRTEALAAGAPLIAEGVIAGEFRPRIAKTCEEALAGADAVFLALPLNGHRSVMDAIAPHLRAGQSVIISSHGSFSALYLSQKLAARDITVPIIGWGTTLTRSRQPDFTRVKIATIRAKVDMAALPVSAAAAGLALCRQLFGDRFVERADMLAVALSNINAQGHLGLALTNLTRIERAEAWGQNENLTPSVGRLLEALDAERLQIAAAFSVKVRTLREHYHLTYGVPLGPLSEVGVLLQARGGDTLGPTSLESRYVTEDVPFGLWPTVLLARQTGVTATLHEAGLNLFSALYGRDFAAENDLLPALAVASLAPADLIRFCREGMPGR